MKKEDTHFTERLSRHRDELKWLYMERYHSEEKYNELEAQLKLWYDKREPDLKEMDEAREMLPDWYMQNDLLGMMLYIDNFADTISGVEEKLSYLEESNINYIHLMPFLDTVPERSDGGYAVADFRTVQKKLGTMEDLAHFTSECRKRGISVCCDFVMNHTSIDHEWAQRALNGEKEYQDRYFFYDNYDIPSQFEQTVPQVFPATAPGNFTYLDSLGKFVMTSFYPYQWDLNYNNPVVFNEMIYNFLFLANMGIDIIRLDAVPYIWKELGTTCRNLPQVHSLVRMMRMISEIVCPGTLLLGEVVMEPAKVVPYFGTVDKPECHMLYNVTTMATTWHTVATRDVRLLKRQLDIVNSLPKQYTFLNYLRCHDDIGWGLDYDTLAQMGILEIPHKNYLNAYFLGQQGNSNSRGELYNYDPITQDARFCGTTASLCGIEKAGFEFRKDAMDKAIDLVIMLHAYMFFQTGIPILYSGDEIGQVNDYSYKKDPEKAADSRYLHRGKMKWENVEKIKDPNSVESKIYHRLQQLEKLRKEHPAFVQEADAWTLETYDVSVLSMGRYFKGEKIIGIFNFSEHDKTAWINEDDGDYEDMIHGGMRPARGVDVPGYGFYWLFTITH